MIHIIAFLFNAFWLAPAILMEGSVSEVQSSSNNDKPQVAENEVMTFQEWLQAKRNSLPFEDWLKDSVAFFLSDTQQAIFDAGNYPDTEEPLYWEQVVYPEIQDQERRQGDFTRMLSTCPCCIPCKDEYKKQLLKSLEAGASLLVPDPYSVRPGSYPLHTAAEHSNSCASCTTNRISLLLGSPEFQQAVNLQNRMGNTALYHLLHRSADPDLCRILLENSADVDILNRNGDSALHLAVQNSVRAVQYILEKVSLKLVCKSFNDVLSGRSATEEMGPFSCVAVELVSDILKRPLHVRNRQNYTPLQLALKLPSDMPSDAQDKFRKVSALVKAGAIESYDPRDFSLCDAIILYPHNQELIEEVLALSGDEMQTLDEWGDHFLLFMFQNDEFLPCITIWSNAGGDVNAPDTFGDSLLHLAMSPKCIITLLNAGARLDHQDHWGHTPLHKAHNVECAHALLDAGASLDVTNAPGDNPYQSNPHVRQAVDEREAREQLKRRFEIWYRNIFSFDCIDKSK